MFNLQAFVDLANEAPETMDHWRTSQKYNKSPPFSIFLVLIQNLFGKWYYIIGSNLPPIGFEEYVYDFTGTVIGIIGVYIFGKAFTPLGSTSFIKMFALGCGANLVYHILEYSEFILFNDPIWAFFFEDGVTVAVIVFYFTLRWKVDLEQEETKKQSPILPMNKRSFVWNLHRHGLCIVLYCLAIGTGVYHHGKMSLYDKEDGEYRIFTVKETLDNIVHSPLFTEATAKLSEIYHNSNSLPDMWENIKMEMDPSGEKRAFGILGLSSTASATEIKNTHKMLALKWHPDKHPSETREKALLKFQEIQKAYELLSSRN